MRRALVVTFLLAGVVAQGPVPLHVVRTIDLTAIEPVEVPPGAVFACGAPAARDVALSSDGRWLIAVLSESVVVIDIDDGSFAELGVAAAEVQAVASAGAGPEALVVTRSDVQRWDLSRQQLLRTHALPTRQREPVQVWQACGGPGSLVALRGWFGGSEPWVGVLDHDTGRWREYAFPHGSMDWSTDGAMLVVGTGHPGCCTLEPACVRLVPRDGGDWQHVPAPGFFSVTSVTCVPGGSFLVRDGSVASCIDGGHARPIAGLSWRPCVALSRHWLLVARDGLALRTFDGGTEVPVPAAGPVSALAVARGARRVVASVPGALQVLEWAKVLPRAPAPRPALRSRPRAGKPRAAGVSAW